jgi:hypothetical protein
MCVFTSSSSAFAVLIEMDLSFESLFIIVSFCQKILLLPQNFRAVAKNAAYM